MKRILYILSAIALLASCTEKMEDAIQVEGVQTINAQFATTKTINQGIKTTWAKGDQMTVFYTTQSRSLGVSCFTQTEGTSFSGNVRNLGKGENDWYAFYPYSLLNLDPEAVLLDVPTTQTQNGNNSTAHLIGDVDPLYGSAKKVKYGDTPNIQMHHTLANVKFTVKNTECAPIKITKIEFTAPSYITGAFTADITSNQLTWNPFILAYKTVVLYVSNGESIAPGQSAEFSANILPNKGKGNYNIRVTAISGGKFVVSHKTVSSEFQFEAGKTTTANHNFSVNGQVDPTTEYKTYTKVDEITPGKSYVIVSNGQALKNANGSTAAYSTSGLISGSTISIPENDVNAVEWLASAQSGFDDHGDFFFTNSNKYLTRITQSNALTVQATPEHRSVWTLDEEGNDLYNINSKEQYVLYMSYSNGTWNANSLDEPTNDIAIYEADSYTPVPPTPTGDKTYTKVTKMTAGKAYVITTDGQAMKNTSGSIETYSTSGKVSANTITIPADDVNSVEWVASKSSYPSKGEFYLANGSKYIARVTSANTLTLESSATEHSAWSLDAAGNDLSQKNSSGQYTFYITYANGSWTANTQSETNKLVIYEADPSDPTPVPPTPSGDTFLLERSNVHSYLEDASDRYTNSNTSTSVINNYCSNNGDDIPAPVTLSWEGKATQIKIYENSTLVKTQTFTSSSTVDIFNLIPGKTYTYQVNNTDNTTSTFRTTGTRRMIKVSDTFNANHARNCRDLGGIKTADGKTLNYGLIFRGTSMDEITEEEKAILKNELGIKLDVDLRGESKNPLGVDISNQYYSDGDAIAVRNAETDAKIGKTLTDILTYVSNNKPVYIHCSYGADRTGYICMILESLLGVSLKDSDIDYELSSFAKAILWNGGRVRGTGQIAAFRTNFGSDPDKVPTTVYNYAVNDLKINPSLIDSFRAAMLEGYVPPTPGTVTYYRVDEIKDGQEYLIVSGGHALKKTGETSFSSVAVTDNDGEITITEDESLLWKVASGNAVSGYGDYTLSNGTSYLSRVETVNTLSLGEFDSVNKKRYVWTYAGTNVNNKKYYLYFDGSDFTLGASGSVPTTNTYFYSKTKPVDTGVEYKKVTSITSGKKYIFVDAADAGKVFTGATAGTAATATISGDSIKSSDLEGYEFTITKGSSDNKYSIIFNDGKYLTCDYSNSSNGTYYTNTKCEFTLEKTAETHFFFYFYNNNGNQYIYYKAESSIFKIGGSGSKVGVNLYERQD